MQTKYSRFVTACKKRGITVKLTEKKYDEMRGEIVPHLIKESVNWKEEIKALIPWLYDHGFRMVDANRIRNRMRKAVKFKREEFAALDEKKREAAHMRGSRTAYTPSVYAQQVVNKNLV